MDANNRWGAMTPNILWIPVAGAFAIGFICLAMLATPLRANVYSLVWFFLGGLGGFTRNVLAAQAKRIKALEDQIAQLHGR